MSDVDLDDEDVYQQEQPQEESFEQYKSEDVEAIKKEEKRIEEEQ